MDAGAGVGDAGICRWLSSILARELSDEAMAAYRDGAASPYLDAIAARVEIGPARNTFAEAVAGWEGSDNPQRTLAADFAELFLMPGPKSAPPYASAYLGGDGVTDLSDERMERMMQNYGVAANMDANEPADHVAVVLEFLAHLHTVDPTGEIAERFRASEIAPWIGEFAEKIGRNPEIDGFYRAVGAILKSYIAK